MNARLRGASWLAGLGVAGVGVLSWPHSVDDAYITARYARSLAAGRGYSFNGGAASDGVTGPLWLLPQTLAAAAGLDPLLVAKLLGGGCATIAAAWCVARLRRSQGGRLTAPLAALMLVLIPTLGSWGVAGLETGLAALLTTAAWIHGLGPRPRPGLAGLWLGLLAWLRPELAPFGAVLLMLLWQRDPETARRALLPAALGALSILLFRKLLFDSWLPLSLAAKPASLTNGLSYTASGLFWLTGVGGVPLIVSAVRRGGTRTRSQALLLAVHFVAVAIAGGDWMPGHRLLAPVVPLYVTLAASGAHGLRLQRRSALLAGCLFTALCVPATELALSVPQMGTVASSRNDRGAALVEALRQRSRRVALVDVGFIGYASELEVIDLGGVTDPIIGRLPGAHLSKPVTEAYLRRRDPDALVLHSRSVPVVDRNGILRDLNAYPVERRVAAMPWVRTHFVVRQIYDYAPSYRYILLTRRPR